MEFCIVVQDSCQSYHSYLVSKYTVINLIHKEKNTGTRISALPWVCVLLRELLEEVLWALSISYINILTKQSKQWSLVPYE